MKSAFRQSAARCPAVAGTRLPLLIVCLSICFHPAAHAAFYQFTIGGTVTWSALAGVNPGDPFTLRYTADSHDEYPSPSAGFYNATEPTVTFPDPSRTITWQGNAAYFEMDLGFDHVGYLSYDPPRAWGVQCSYYFPSGTLASDELPLTLPFERAIFARLYIFPIYNNILEGNITSYGAVEVPEPSALVFPLASFVAMRRRNARDPARKEVRCEGKEASALRR